MLKQVVSIPSSTPIIYQALMNCNTYLDTSQSIDVWRFWICKSVFWPWWQGFSTVSCSKSLEDIKAIIYLFIFIFYSCHHRHVDYYWDTCFCEAAVTSCASLGYVPSFFQISKHELKTLHQTTTIKLLVSYGLRFVQMRSFYKIKSNWRLA